MGLRSLLITTTIQVSTSTESHKVTVSITGQMGVFTRGISVMEQDMGMAFGKVRMRLTSDLIEWTISKGSECTHGRTRKSIKDSSETTIGTAMGKYIR